VARIWEAATGEPVTPPLRTSAFLFRASFSPDGNRLITAGQDRLPKIWDARSGGLLLNLVGHQDTCAAAVFSPDGRRVATGNKDQTVRVWDAETGRLVSPILSHSAYVETVELHPDGNQLVTACDDGTVRLWELGMNDLTFRPWQDESPLILAVTEDGRRLLTQDKNKRVQVWDCSTWQAVGLPLIESNEVLLAALGSDGRLLLAVGGKAGNGVGDWEFNLWDTTSGKRLTSAAAPAGLHCVPWIGENLACVAILRTNAVEVFKLTAGGATPASLMLPQATKAIRDVDEPLHAAFSPDGKMLVTLDGTNARVWNVTDGRQRFDPLPHAYGVFHAQFSSDGRWLVTTCSDAYLAARPAQVWDAQSGRPVGPPLPHNDGVLFARFSPDGTALLTCSEDATARLWNPQTGAPLAPPLRHQHYVNWATFSSDGRRVLTGCVDGTARLWDAHTGEPLTPFLAHATGSVEAGGILADGQGLLTRSGTNWAFRQLPSDSRSAEDWRALAQLLSGHQLDATGTLESVAANSLSDLWTRLRP
jgi:WD40 repeat protein